MAGVSINLVLGNNGIINKSKEAELQTRAGTVADEVELWKADIYLANNTNNTAEAESAMLARLRTNNLITDDDEVDTTNKVIKIKRKDGTVVREIPYSNVKINISMSKLPTTEEELYVLLKVTSVDGLETMSINTDEDFNELCQLIESMEENRKKGLVKNLYVKLFNEENKTIFNDFTEIFEYRKANESNFSYKTEDEFYKNEIGDVPAENIVTLMLAFYGDSETGVLMLYEVINPDGYISESYIATKSGSYTFTVKGILGDTYTKTVAVDNTTEITEMPNIFEYTEAGVITGIKKEFLIDKTFAAQLKENIKLATLNADNGIKVAFAEPKYYLKNELNGWIIIPKEIEGTKIVGIADYAFGCIKNLTNVIILEGVRTIGDQAFISCTNLTNVIIEEGVSSIGNWAFSSCNISEITIPETVANMGEKVFYDNTGITVHVPFEEDKQPSTWVENWNVISYNYSTSPATPTYATVDYKQPTNN